MDDISVAARLGGSLRRLRELRDMSLADVAARSGVPRTYIWAIEVGKPTANPTLRALSSIAGVFERGVGLIPKRKLGAMSADQLAFIERVQRVREQALESVYEALSKDRAARSVYTALQKVLRVDGANDPTPTGFARLMAASVPASIDKLLGELEVRRARGDAPLTIHEAGERLHLPSRAEASRVLGRLARTGLVVVGPDSSNRRRKQVRIGPIGLIVCVMQILRFEVAAGDVNSTPEVHRKLAGILALVTYELSRPIVKCAPHEQVVEAAPHEQLIEAELLTLWAQSKVVSRETAHIIMAIPCPYLIEIRALLFNALSDVRQHVDKSEVDSKLEQSALEAPAMKHLPHWVQTSTVPVLRGLMYFERQRLEMIADWIESVLFEIQSQVSRLDAEK